MLTTKKTKAAICQICSSQASKYKCPTDFTQYCSTACYKIHSSSENHLPKPPNVPAVEQCEDLMPTRSLNELSYPPDPPEALFTDPLNKNEYKGLRNGAGKEWEAIVTSAKIRSLLQSNPQDFSNTPLKLLLNRISSLPDEESKTDVLRELLSSGPSSTSTGSRGGKRKREMTKLEWLDEDREKVVEFLETVKSTLAVVRAKN